jgi:type IV secretory pathway TraG/TraD family ATPase VirD4
MTFDRFFSYAPEVSLLCGLLLIGLLLISPMGRYLKTGLLVLLLPLIYANYAHFSDVTADVLHEVLFASRRPGFAKTGNFLTAWFHWIAVILGRKDLQIPVLLNLAIGFTVYEISRSVAIRFFMNSARIRASIETIFAVLTTYATHGLIILPIIVIQLLAWSRASHIQEKVLSGTAAIKDQFEGLLIARLRFIMLRANGIFIHPLLRIPLAYENRGFIAIGAPNSGKTYTIMTHFLPQFRRRGDKVIIFDYKRDFTQKIGEDDDVMIASPLDARSVIWDVARDIDTEARAWEFAAMIVQKGDGGRDAVFEDWAKDMLCAIIIKLQVERRHDWGFREFYDQSQDLDLLIEAVKKYRKESSFIANFTGNSRQFEAIKGTIRRAMVRMEPLARAWGDRSRPDKLLSLSSWINDPLAAKKTIVITYDPAYQETIGPWVSNFLNQAILIVLSRPDNKGRLKDFRLVLCIDEAQQLPYIPKLMEAPRAGRSKGLRLLLGTQDLGRFDELYKSDGAREALLNLIGFKLIGHLGSEGMQNFAAGLLSKNHIQVRKQNPHPGKAGSSHSIENRYEPAIAPGEFGAIPIPTSYNGSMFWLVHQGWNPVRLRYITPYVADKYPAKVDAAWLSDKDRDWTRLAVVEVVELPIGDEPQVPTPNPAKAENQRDAAAADKVASSKPLVGILSELADLD